MSYRNSEWFAFNIMVLGALAFFGFIVGMIFLFQPKLQNTSRATTPLYSFDATPLSVQVGSVQLSVPKNHIREMNNRQDKQTLVLHALLPDLEAYRSDNWWLFENKTPSAKMITIQINKVRNIISEQTKFQFLAKDQLEKVASNYKQLGLEHYLYKKEPKRSDQDVFAGFDGNNRRLVYFCFRTTQLSVSPHCLRTYNLSLDATLTYKFKRNHIHRWREIEGKIKTFIQKIHRLSFYQERDLEAKNYYQ